MSRSAATAWVGSALGTRVARRLLLAFLLLGIIPAAITLGVIVLGTLVGMFSGL